MLVLVPWCIFRKILRSLISQGLDLVLEPMLLPHQWPLFPPCWIYSNGFWNYSLLEEIFEAQAVATIKKKCIRLHLELRIHCCGCQPRMVLFLLNPLIIGCTEMLHRLNWKALWKLTVHERLKFFFWQLCVGGLPLRANVSKRLPWVSSQCILCNNLVED